MVLATVTRENMYVRQFRWHIIPMFNPDGYEYTHTTDRFWSKNRRPFRGNATLEVTRDECNGVNLNRNFPSGYGLGPTDPCDR